MVAKRAYITDYIGLDIMRFFLSLAVVLRHYFFFYYRLLDLGPVLRNQPHYHVLGIFYKYGHYSVQVFWLISGIIFQSVYYEDIAASEIGFGEYAFLRFSRLYPLHFVTLLIMAMLQYTYLSTYNTFFVYQPEDIKHFLMQLLFMGSWYPFFEHSFNIPVWSVSIEIFVYIVFFLLALAGILKNKGLYVVVAVTIIFNLFGILNPFGECLTFFFCGCVLARAINKGVSLQSLLIKYGVAAVVCAGIVALVHHYYPNLSEDTVRLLIDVPLIPVASFAVIASVIVFRNVKSKGVLKIFKNMGNMTYSLYLVHCPVQLAILLILKPENPAIFDNTWFLLLYLAISVAVGWLVFEYFEKPAQKYLRLKYTALRAGRTAQPNSDSGTNSDEGSKQPASNEGHLQTQS